jgi:class 3 adenylate cyclase/tetratricopeptide (TPR) repeat protein
MASTTATPEVDLAAPYIPRLLLGWGEGAPRHRQVEGSLVSADISGFTALSERLAGYGREGAEELTVLLNRCFGPMIEIVEARGGDVLKFGGDALLILFTGADHTARAAGACWQMRQLIERNWSTRLVRRVELGISQGIHSGTFDLHLVNGGHEELLVVGPGMTSTVDCEGAADRGEILLSSEAAALLDGAVLGPPKEHGRALVDDVGEYLWLVDDDDDDDAIRSSAPFVPDWLREQVRAGQVAEHRVVSVAFVFFGGLDAVLTTDGPEAGHEVLTRLADAVEEVARRHGVYWLASDVYPGGGKIILTAGAPTSTGQDEDALARAVRAVLDVDVGLPLRAGVNAGPVFMGDLGSERRRTFTVMGDTVNLAARLMQKSQPGEMVVSRQTLEGIRTTVTGDDLEPFLVKGKTDPIHASTVESIEDEAATEDHRADEVEFVGREDELATLQELVDRARDRRGSVVDLVGEPGIGKSRLVAEVLERNADLIVVHTRGGLYSRSTPYLAVRTVLRELAGCESATHPEEAGERLTRWVRELDPDLLAWLPLLAVAFDAVVPTTPEVERISAANRASKLREVVVDLLNVALPKASAIVIDDAHWLDKASDELFLTLSHRVTSRPWVVVALRRADTDGFAVRHAGAVAIELGELDPDDTRRLAAAAVAAGLGSDDDQIDDLLERGVTNPLFLLELVRSGPEAGTPDSVEALVTARIDMLDASNRRLLRESAVLGAIVDPELLGEALGDTDLERADRWTPLAGFVQSWGDGLYRFEHSLYREVAYDGLSFRRRQQLHTAIGTAYEARAGDDPESSSELLSLHFHRAKDWARSWRYSVIAGDRARAKYANVAAASFYDRAIETSRRHRVSRPEVAGVAEALGDVAELAARYDQADKAISLARRLTDDDVAAIRLLRKEGTLRVRSGRFTQGLRFYGRGLTSSADLADAAERHAQEGQLCLAYAGARFRQGKSKECVRWARRANEHAKAIGDNAMLAHAYYLLGIGSGVQSPEKAEPYLRKSLALFERDDDLLGQANVLNNLGVDARDYGRWDEAVSLYERSREARDLIGDVVGAATASNNIAEILSDQGHLDEAERLLEYALRIWRRADFAIGVALATSYLGRLNARRGNYEESSRLLAEALERFRDIGAAHYVLETQVFTLECDLLANRPYLLEGVRALITTAEERGELLLRNILLRLQAWELEQLGRHEEAVAAADAAIKAGEEARTPFEVALAHVLRGQLLRAAGGDRRPDHDRARRILEDLGVVSLPRLRGG